MKHNTNRSVKRKLRACRGKKFTITEGMIQERLQSVRERGWDEDTIEKLERLLRDER